jgi:heat shock protein HslJ
MRKVMFAVAAVALVSVLVACSSSGGGLTGKTWQLTATTTTVPASQGVVTDPQNYTIEFKSDGTFNAKADCNNVGGTYTTSGSSLTIVPGPSTLVACPEGSLGDVYVAGLGNAATYAIANGQLTITTKDESTLTFK